MSTVIVKRLFIVDTAQREVLIKNIRKKETSCILVLYRVATVVNVGSQV